MDKKIITAIKDFIINLLHLPSILITREVDVLSKRLGIGLQGNSVTLEEIGQTYGLTRERVRQIENHAYGRLKKAFSTRDTIQILSDLEEYFFERNEVISVELFNAQIGESEEDKKLVSLFLVLSGKFIFFKEDESIKAYWSSNSEVATVISQGLEQLSNIIEDQDLLPEEEMVKLFLQLIDKKDSIRFNPKNALDFLRLSKEVGRNCMNEWGKVSSPMIKLASVNDWSYYVLKKKNAQMHFSDVANEIQEKSGIAFAEASCHNALVKDKRFVLIGRGLYALRIWGYEDGFTIDVIKSILSEIPAISSKSLTDKVLQKRSISKNAVLMAIYVHRSEFLIEKGLISLVKNKESLV